MVRSLKKPEEDKPEVDYGEKKDTRPCLCGGIHRFSQCLYFIPSLRPANWTEDLDIRKKIDATLRDKPGLKNVIKVARQGVKNAEKKKNSGEGNGSHTGSSATDHSTPSENLLAKQIPIDLPVLLNPITLCERASLPITPQIPMS